jgi:ribulose-5-phosphate 4-epimerase/fuculose-1-phosphate aldolase
MADATQARTDPTRHEALVAAERALVEAEEDLSAFLLLAEAHGYDVWAARLRAALRRARSLLRSTDSDP